jgi:hypothetical protein
VRLRDYHLFNHYESSLMKLMTVKVPQDTQKQNVVTSMNRLVCLDCSGSMSSDLPKIRTMLKNKLPTMIQPQDTLTIIWFSGKGQCGVLFEATKLDTLEDIQRVNAAIDRFIRPIGATGFKAPLELVQDLTKRLSGDCTLSFLTDGFENVSTKKEILEICKSLSDKLTSVTMVEFSYYADHQMLMDMAEEIGGSVVLAENFTNYSESLESTMKTSVSGKKIKLSKITAEYVIGNLPDGFVIARPDAVGTVTLPTNTVSYSYFEGAGEIDNIELGAGDNLSVVGYAVSALILKGQADKALQLASVIGDVELYHQVENSFSKQDYARTVEMANAFGSGKKRFYSKPRQTNLIPDENAYNVLTLLMDLASEDGNYLDLSHESFAYESIGAKRETAEIGEGEAAFKPVFKDKTNDIKAEITKLTFDEDRPNISILVRREGTVTLPENDLGFKDTIDSHIWRNYAIVKDGIINVRFLPVVLSKASYDLMKQLEVIDEPFKIGHTYVIDTKRFPIINRSMATPTTADSLFRECFDLYRLKVRQKVLGTKIEKAEFGQKFAALYGDEGAKFLKELGISEGGFSPKTTKGESLDPYIAKVLEVKMAGLNTIPTVDAVEKAIASGKTLTPAQKVMADSINSVLLGVTDYVAELKATVAAVRALRNHIVQVKFGIILGRKWFTDMTNLDDNTRTIDFGLGKDIVCQVLLSDKEV